MLFDFLDWLSVLAYLGIGYFDNGNNALNGYVPMMSE